jgi:hypothetical protein
MVNDLGVTEVPVSRLEAGVEKFDRKRRRVAEEEGWDLGVEE